MSVPRPLLDAAARAVLESIDHPLTLAQAVRDRDGRLLDFRLEYANRAATTWAGLPQGAMIGHLATDLIPGLRPAGLYDALADVVQTGRPFRQQGQPYEGNVEAGRTFSGIFDLLAIRLGDGYLSLWTERPEHGRAPDLDALVQQAVAAVPLVRLEARRVPRLVPRPAF
jgi:PAS domain-containing protein